MITQLDFGMGGRLGNNLFTIASVIGIATKHNHEYSFNKWKYQDYFKNPLPVSNIHLNDITWIQKETSFSYQEFDIPKEGVINIEGYLQSWKYFSHCEDLIRKQFEFKCTGESIYLVNANDLFKTASIHVRRTDYLTASDYHYNLPMEYYYEAMSASGVNEFLVFSDDIEWCKQQDWKCKKVYFSDEATEMQDFERISLCGVNIIANSSFSWWASYLNTNPDKIVIAPEKYYWFGKNARYNDVSDLYLPNWKIINL